MIHGIPLRRLRNIQKMSFQIEMKFKAWKYGFNLVEVPVIFTDRTEGVSKTSSGIFMEAVLGVIEMKIKSFFRSWNR